VEEILEEKEEENLRSHGGERGEGNMVCFHAQTFSSGVKQPYLNEKLSIRQIRIIIIPAYQGQFNREMGVQNELGTLPLLLGRRDLIRLELPFAKIRHGINNNPGNASTKVDDLRKQMKSNFSEI
jgi:hypothetical protein